MDLIFELNTLNNLTDKIAYMEERRLESGEEVEFETKKTTRTRVTRRISQIGI